MVLPITAFYASLLGICYLYLSFLVIGARRRHQVGIGDGGLIMIACFEANTGQVWAVHALGSALLFGRVLHAYGLGRHSGVSWQRFAGMILTFLAMLCAAIGNLVLIHFGL